MSRARVVVLLSAVLVMVLAAVPAGAQGGTATARLRPFDEVPALSTGGGGHFSATISADGSEITYQLSYLNLSAAVLQSHLHFAQKGVNGGIMIFLCSNLGNGPAGTQTCPTGGGTISGTIHASDVIGGAFSQGVTPGDLNAVLRGLRIGVVYVNVHTTNFPGGEIRGQLQFTPTP
ncbi:MAG TPA: CHRD domain-containing protein [Thermoanaerobaculia bacterium]